MVRRWMVAWVAAVVATALAGSAGAADGEAYRTRQMVREMKRRASAAMLQQHLQVVENERLLRDSARSRIAAELDSYLARIVVEANAARDNSYWHYAANQYGVRYEVPLGAYDSDGLIGVAEQVTTDASGYTQATQNYFRLGLPSREKRMGGWSFEPAGVLVRKLEVIDAAVDEVDLPNPAGVPQHPTDYVTTCTVDVGWVYGDANDLVEFGDGEPCVVVRHYTTSLGDPGRIVGTDACMQVVPNACDGVGSPELWSYDGQVALRVSGESIDIRRPDGSRIVFGPPASPAALHHTGLTDPHWNPVVYDARNAWSPLHAHDRNGNLTRYGYDADGFVQTVTDEAGRVTRYVRDPGNPTIREIHTPGAGGEPLVHRLSWSTHAWRPSSVGATQPPGLGSADISFAALDELTMPDGRAYTFEYGQDTGYLERVVEPSGAIVEYAWGDPSTPYFPPPGTEGVDPPAGTSLLLSQRLVGTTTWPEGLDGPSYTVRHEQDDSRSITLPWGGLSALNWYEDVGPDEDGDGDPDWIVREIRGADHPLAQEVWQDDRLLEGTYFMNLGGASAIDESQVCAGASDESQCWSHPSCQWQPHSPDDPSLGGSCIGAAGVPLYDTYLEAERDPYSTAARNSRPWRIVHVRDGVQWYEELTYQPYAFPGRQRPAAPCYPDFQRRHRCTSVHTTGNVVEHVVYAADGTRLMSTTTAYETGDGYLQRNLLRLPRRVEIRGGAGETLALTETLYDELGLVDSGAPNLHDVGPYRGNPTRIRAHVDAAHAIETRIEYDDTGAVRRTAAPRAHGDLDGAYTTTTTIDHAACSESAVHETSVVRPLPGDGNVAVHASSMRTDCWSGLTLSSTAVDGATTCHRYDALGRLLEVAGPGDALSSAEGVLDPACAPSDAGTGPTTTIVHEPAIGAGGHGDPRAQRIVTTAKNGADGVRAIVFVDGLDRTIAACDEVDPDHAGGARFSCSRTRYDALGREVDTSIPFFVDDEPTRVPEPAASVQRLVRTLDALGRPTAVELSGSGLGPILTEYGGDGDLLVEVETDRNGYDTVRYTDVLGHLVRVDREWVEADDEGSQPCSGGWCTTVTTHDALGRRLSLSEDGGQQPTTLWDWDWLGRQTWMRDADIGGFLGEDGVVRREYDEHGNEIRRTDPRGDIVTFQYDALDRLVRKTLPSALSGDDAEREITLFYDGTGPQVPQ